MPSIAPPLAPSQLAARDQGIVGSAKERGRARAAHTSTRAPGAMAGARALTFTSLGAFERAWRGVKSGISERGGVGRHGERQAANSRSSTWVGLATRNLANWRGACQLANKLTPRGRANTPPPRLQQHPCHAPKITQPACQRRSCTLALEFTRARPRAQGKHGASAPLPKLPLSHRAACTARHPQPPLLRWWGGPPWRGCTSAQLT